MEKRHDLIDRQDAIDAARDWYEGLICGSFRGLEKRLRAVPSAQPTYTDAELQKLQDMEQAQLEKAFELGQEDTKPQWIPFTRRKPTEDEGTEFDYIMDCECPEDGQNILVSINVPGHECVQYDTYYGGGGEECCLESGYELVSEAVAWMPLPEPYAERKDDV